MVGNTPKMMFGASKIDQGMAKEITRKFERIFKNFSSFWLLQSGLCNVAFLSISTMTVAILFSGHASDAFEIAVEGGGFGEAQQVGGFLKCLCGTRLDESLGLCGHILLYPCDR